MKAQTNKQTTTTAIVYLIRLIAVCSMRSDREHQLSKLTLETEVQQQILENVKLKTQIEECEFQHVIFFFVFPVSNNVEFPTVTRAKNRYAGQCEDQDSVITRQQDV